MIPAGFQATCREIEVTEMHRSFPVLPETGPQQAALRRVKLRCVCVGCLI